MTILVCGSRRRANRDIIRRELSAYPAGTRLVHGDNGYDRNGKALWGQPDELAVRGADKLAGAIGRELDFEVRRYTPDWKTFGLKAGPMRNGDMLFNEEPDEVLAFTANLSASIGTRDCVTQARRMGIPVRVIGEGE